MMGASPMEARLGGLDRPQILGCQFRVGISI